MLNEQQLALRRTGITATDIAAIVGKHPYRTAIDVWREKIGEGKVFDPTVRSQWGDRLEPMIRSDYAERHRLVVTVPGTLVHPERPWQLATPDGVCYFETAAEPHQGLEIKVHGPDARFIPGMVYGPAGTDEVPVWELLQCLWNIDVLGVDRWDLVAFDGAPTEYTVERDDELLGILHERAERFLVDHVRANVPPPPDGSESYDEWIATQWNEHNADKALIKIDDEPELLALVAQLHEIVVRMNADEDEAERLKQIFKVRIGNNAGVEYPGRTPKQRDKLTYKRPKDSIVTDYKTAAIERGNDAALVVGALTDDIQRAKLALDSIADAHFENSRATIRAADVRALISKMEEALKNIASDHRIAVNTKVVPNARSFLRPQWWTKKA